MIILDAGPVNVITQKLYDSLLELVLISSLECPHCHHHAFIYHGVYSRKVKDSAGLSELIVQRVRCRECGHTHALLPAFLIPYCQIALSAAIRIIQVSSPDEKEEIMRSNPSIDESDIVHVSRKWKSEWRERLKAFNIAMNFHLTELCILNHGHQFLQNHCRSPVSFHTTT